MEKSTERRLAWNASVVERVSLLHPAGGKTRVALLSCSKLEQPMRFAGRAALWPIMTSLLVLCLAAVGASQTAPSPSSPAQSAPSQAAPAQTGQAQTAPAQAAPQLAAPAATTPEIHTIAHLEGPWRFQIGDGLQWADPAFDDSTWSTVTLDKPLSELGFESYAGYAWYRIRVNVKQFQSPGEPVELLLSTHNIGQISVYANGTEINHTRGLEGTPRM